MVEDVLFADLRALLRVLATEAHSMSPSIYDTAMVVRLAPPSSIWPAFDWLLDKQASDGGWGDMETDIRARTMPTLAVILLLATRQERHKTRVAIATGLAWLRRSSSSWAGPVPDDVPIGVELLLPALLDEAERQGLAFFQGGYQELRALGEQRRTRIARLSVGQLASSTAAHSWEAFGTVADPQLVHPISGVGGSPAATAAWIQRAAPGPARELAHAYLQRAELATSTGIPGMCPTVFPIPYFMQAYSLHTLAQAGLLGHAAISDLVDDTLQALAATMTPEGIGFAAGIMPDGDDTAAALGAMLTVRRTVDLAPLRRFAVADHFATYGGELQPSLITTARAVQVYHAAGEDCTPFRQWIARRQHIDGRWLSDKWNSFWGYSTWQAILALRDDPAYGAALARATEAILVYQQHEGGWGISWSTPEATAYLLLALAALPEVHQSAQTHAALARGRQWLLLNYRPFAPHQEYHWVGKEWFSPLRLSRIIVIAALLATEPLCATTTWP